MHDTANSHRAVPSLSNPELFAGSLLGRVDAAGILRLLELLPSEAPARGSREVGVASEFSFTTGAYTAYTYDHGARHGLRQNCRDFPLVTQALNDFMRARAPDARYTALAMFRDLRTRVHADKGNDPCQVNTIVKLRNFQGGGLWVQGPPGQVKCPLPGETHRRGFLVDFKAGVLQFNAQAPHCVVPWTAGPRVVPVAFTVRVSRNFQFGIGMTCATWVFQCRMQGNRSLRRCSSLLRVPGPPAVRPVMPIVLQVLSGPLVPCNIQWSRVQSVGSLGTTPAAVQRVMSVLVRTTQQQVPSRRMA